MWSDLQADPPRCPGSGEPALPATTLPDRFPAGRALCPACLGFFPLTAESSLAEHDAFRGARSAEEASARAEWFNTFGWTR